MGEHVVLVHQGEVPAGAGGRAGEGVAHHALDAEAGVDADLGGDLVGRAGAQRAAVADVGALGALAHDDEVDAVRRHPLDGQRALDTRVEPGRAQVDVVLHGEAERQQDAALEHAARHARVADRAEQDGVVPLQLVEHRVGQRLAGGVPATGTQVVLGGGDLRAGLPDDRLEHLQALGDDLGADAVAADDGEVEGLRRGLGHGVQPRERYRDADGRPSPWKSGTAGRAVAPTQSGGPGSGPESVVAVPLIPQVHRLLECLAGQGGLVESGVLVHRCLPSTARAGAGRSGGFGARAEECLGEPVSDVAGLRGEGADYRTSPRLGMRRSTSSRRMSRRYVDVLLPASAFPPCGRATDETCHPSRGSARIPPARSLPDVGFRRSAHAARRPTPSTRR